MDHDRRRDDTEEELVLSEADFKAADAALTLFPALGQLISNARAALARSHHRLGESDFQLLHGLRPPNDLREELALAHYAGNISREECGRGRRKYLEQNLDEATLELFFTEIRDELEIYGQIVRTLLQASDEAQSLSTAGELDGKTERLFKRWTKKMSFYAEEIEYLSGFIAEARIVLGSGTVQIDNYQGASYVVICMLLRGTVRDAWRTRDRDTWNARGVSSVAQFYRSNREIFLRPMDLEAMLEHECAVARIYLRDRSANTKHCHNTGKAPMTVHAEHVTVQVNDTTLTTRQTERQEGNNQLFSVRHWSELAIGIDEHRNYWALTPLPELGRDFRMTSAHRLPVGGRWPQFLNLLAESADGSSARSSDVMKILGGLPAAPNAPTDGRVRRRQNTDAIRDELPNRQNAARTKLNNDLAELARQLRQYVGGPTKRNHSALYVEGELVRSRFVVRALVKDRGHVKFGLKPI